MTVPDSAPSAVRVAAFDAAARVRLRLLGAADTWIRHDAEWTPVPMQAKRFALFAYLTLAGRPVRREHVLGVFWPEANDTNARGALSKALHYLRATVGADCLVSTEDTVHVVGVDSDVAAQARCLAQGQVVEALALASGPLLDGVHVDDAPEFERWLDAERARLESTLVRAAHAAMDDAEQRGALDACGELARALLERVPLDERAAQRLMRWLDRTGDRAGALRVFDRFELAMRRALDIAPSPETRAVADAIRVRVHTEREPVPVRSPQFEVPAEPPAIAEAEHVVTPVVSASGAPLPGGAPPARPGVPRVRIVAAVLTVALAGIGLWHWPPSRLANLSGSQAPTASATDERPVVVVAPFADRTRTGANASETDSAYTALSDMAADWITQGLAQSGEVRVLPLTTMLAVNGALNGSREDTPRDARGTTPEPDAGADRLSHAGWRVARETGAGVVVTGSVYRRGDTVVFSAAALDARSGTTTLVIDPVRVSVTQALDGLDSLRARVLLALAPQLDTRVAESMRQASRPRSLAAYRAYVLGLQAFTGAEWGEAMRRFREASALDPAWPLPRLHLGLAASNLGDTPTIDSVIAVLRPLRTALAPYDQAGFDAVVAWRTGDRDGAYRAAVRAARLAPSGMAAAQVGKEAFALGRPREAVQHFAAFDPLRAELRGYPLYWVDFADALHASGQHHEERALLLRADSLGFGATPWFWRLRMRAAIAQRDPNARRQLLDSLDAGWMRLSRTLQGGMILQDLAEESLAHGDTTLGRVLARRAIGWFATLPDSARRLPRLAQRTVELHWLANDSAGAHAMVDALPSMARDVVSHAHRALVALARGDTVGAAQWRQRLSASEPTPRYGLDALWRARLLAVAGDGAAASEALRAAHAAGWSYRTAWHTDPWLRRALRHAPLQALIEPRQ